MCPGLKLGTLIQYVWISGSVVIERFFAARGAALEQCESLEEIRMQTGIGAERRRGAEKNMHLNLQNTHT